MKQVHMGVKGTITDEQGDCPGLPFISLRKCRYCKSPRYVFCQKWLHNVQGDQSYCPPLENKDADKLGRK